MPRAQFEEKQYEIAFTAELAYNPRGPLGVVVAAGQVLEHILGFDAVADPDPGHVIWRVLGLPRPPSLQLLPEHWDPGRRPLGSDLPVVPVSLVLQYKRPEFIVGRGAAQWRFWHQPYFRFRKNRSQDAVLRRLERRLMDDAVVRYAAPAFWQRSELEAAQLAMHVIRTSGFVSPRVMVGHDYWTYVWPGMEGWANPAAAPRQFEDVDAFFGSLRIRVDRPNTELLPRDNGLSSHLSRLGAAARNREPRLRGDVDAWLRTVRSSDIPIDDQQTSDLRNYVSFSSLMGQLQASWFLTG